MNELKIQAGIPVPEPGRNNSTRKAMSQMKIGDSIACEFHIEVMKLYSCGRNMGFKMIQRKQEDGTFRVWRVN